MIVDLAIEDNDSVTIITDEWLIAATQVDDLQTHRAQRGGPAFINSLLIRTAMEHRLRDPLSNTPSGRLPKAREPRDSTHVKTSPVTHSPRGQIPKIKTVLLRSIFRWNCVHYITRHWLAEYFLRWGRWGRMDPAL